MSVRIVGEGIAFGEGPIALPNGDVLVVEVMGGRLARISRDGTKTIVAETGGGPNGAAIGPDGRCYICNNGGMGASASPDLWLPTETPHDQPPGSIQAVDLATGMVETLYAHSEATPFWGPNDLVFDSAGGFWFTDYGRNQGRIRQRGSIYYAQPDGSSCVEMAGPFEGANGIGLSPDGATLYVAESYSGHVWAFALAGPGRIDGEASLFSLPGKVIGRAGSGQFLDSLAIDSAGNVCVASPGGGAILVFPPEGGPPETIPMPDFLTTNLAFGGPDLRTAFVTLSSTGRLAAIEWPRPGLALAY